MIRTLEVTVEVIDTVVENARNYLHVNTLPVPYSSDVCGELIGVLGMTAKGGCVLLRNTLSILFHIADRG